MKEAKIARSWVSLQKTNSKTHGNDSPSTGNTLNSYTKMTAGTYEPDFYQQISAEILNCMIFLIKIDEETHIKITMYKLK